MLRPLQQRLVSLITELPEAAGFALAGGAALVIRGEVHRTTSDLDFFATDAEAVGRLSEAVEKAAAQAGLACRRERTVLGFAQLEIADGDDVCRVDPAYDARIRPLDQTPAATTLALEELAADKVLALFGRAEARDFIDVAAMVERFGGHAGTSWRPRRTQASIGLSSWTRSARSSGSGQSNSTSIRTRT